MHYGYQQALETREYPAVKLDSYLLGGFECSTHRRFDGRRLDMVAATRHDEFAGSDYLRLADAGIRSARDGLRWHLIERVPGRYDFGSASRQIDAAMEAGVQVIWDLFHYGYPDDIDIFGSDFCRRFTDYSVAFVRHHQGLTGRAPLIVPVNEISFFSWIAGDVGRFYPYGSGLGAKLKKQLARAAISAVRGMRAEIPETTVCTSEPAVYVTARETEPYLDDEADSYRCSQFEALDMLTGRLFPELGGGPDVVDLIGLNYYPHNQWFYPDREMIPLGDVFYRPLSWILTEYFDRYKTPIFISETGAEDEVRPIWVRYVADQCQIARSRNVDLRGICIYPVVNHPGWDDERHCYNGLWDYADRNGHREVCQPLEMEISRLAAQAASDRKYDVGLKF